MILTRKCLLCAGVPVKSGPDGGGRCRIEKCRNVGWPNLFESKSTLTTITIFINYIKVKSLFKEALQSGALYFSDREVMRER